MNEESIVTFQSGTTVMFQWKVLGKSIDKITGHLRISLPGDDTGSVLMNVYYPTLQ